MTTPFGYDLMDDPILCTLSKSCHSIPSGAVASCHPNPDSDYPDKDQFCAYQQDGTLIGAPGCCNPPCPSPHCPSTKSSKPKKIYTKTTDTSPSINHLPDAGCVKTCAFDKSKFTSKPYCYSNNIENPNQEQVCAYETGDGSLTIVDGCCDKICPSLSCPNEMFSPPEMVRNTILPTPFSKLIRLLLILFAILIVSAIIFSLV